MSVFILGNLALVTLSFFLDLFSLCLFSRLETLLGASVAVYYIVYCMS